jgi:hypothetical protein
VLQLQRFAVGHGLSNSRKFSAIGQNCPANVFNLFANRFNRRHVALCFGLWAETKVGIDRESGAVLARFLVRAFCLVRTLTFRPLSFPDFVNGRK